MSRVRRSRRLGTGWAVGAALLVAGCALWAGCGGGGAGRDDEDGAAGATRSASFDLYFPGEGGRLYAEERELEVTGEPRDRARAIVVALLEGPRSRTFYRPFPEGVGLIDLYFDRTGTVYVDLGAEGQELPPASGSAAEMARVYSVVDSVVYNVSEARRVVLLWNGVQRETFAGHLDTGVPIEPAMSILAPGAQARMRSGAQGESGEPGAEADR